MQRSSMPVPTINFPPGTMIFNHGSNAGPSGQTPFYTIVPPNQSHNGVAVLGQGQSYSQAAPMSNMPPGAFHHPPPNPSNPYATAGYPSDIVQGGSYGSHSYIAPPYFPGPTFAPAYVTPQFAPAYSNGSGQAYSLQPSTGFVGPSAMEIQMTPTIAIQSQQQAGPPVSMVAMPSNGSNAGPGNLAVATHQQQQGPSQAPSQQQRREKKVLQVIDPATGIDQMVDVLKEKEQHESVARSNFRPNTLWKPPVDQQQQNLSMQPASVSNLPAGATSVEQRPSRSGSGTPHLEQPKSHSARSSSRGQSPVFEAPQKVNEAKVQEFYLQFGQQLDRTDQPLSEQQLQASHHDDTVLMPPPTAVPPGRAPSKGQSRQTSGRTPPLTPPAVPNQTHPAKSSATFEFGVDHSSVSSLPAKKPKDIIGKPEIEFGWLNVSTGDRSLDTTDGEAIESELLLQKDIIVPGTDNDYCSTPEKQQPPPLDAGGARSPALETDSGRRSDTAPKSPRDRAYLQQPHSAQGLFNGGSADKFGFPANDVASAANTFSGLDGRNASYDQQDSVDESEIRDMVFEPSQPANGSNVRTMTCEEKAAALAVIEELKRLEAPDGRNCYSHEFMMAAAKLPSSKTRPQFQTERWSKDNIDEVFNLNRQASQIKMDTRGRSAAPMGTGFAPLWMSGGMPMDMAAARRPYPGRVSDTTGSMRGDRGGKGSRQGPGGGRGGNKQPPLVIARPSIDVELKTSENAWKPAHKGETISDPEMAETKKLFKEIRGILNKITPQTFDELSAEFLALGPRMNTAERANGVVDIVFQKAVDEPSFCTMYSDLYDQMTRHQYNSQQQATGSQQQPTKGSTSAANRETNFRWILLNKCQSEYERDKRLEASRQEREAAIASAETPEQKKQLQEELDEFLMKEKRRTLGNMRFIGELYLKDMLTSKIMHRCVMELLKTEDEELLECVCKLLTTIGGKLDVDGKDMNLQTQCEVYYKRLRELSGGLSSRVRFMIVDLLELRADSWKPRRKGEGPKTIEQLHRDAAKEKFEQQQELLQEEKRKQEFASQQDGRRGGGRRDLPNRPSYGPADRSDHDGRGGKGDRGGGGGRERDQNRQSGRSGPGASSQQPSQPSADLSKAKVPNLSQHLGGLDTEVRLGPSRTGWGKPKGVTGPAAAAPRQSDLAQTKLTNRFDHLPRSEVVGGSVPGSRDSSQTRQEDGQKVVTAARKLSGASTAPKYPAEEEQPAAAGETGEEDSGKRELDVESVRDSTPSTSQKPPAAAAAASDMTDEQLQRYSYDLLDELVDANNFVDALKLVDDKLAHTGRIFWHALNYVAEKHEKQRPAAIRMLGALTAHSFTSDQRKTGVVSGLSSFVRYVIDEDIAQDVPKIWAYVGQVLGAALSTLPAKDIDLIDFGNVFREAGGRGPELLAQTLLAVSSFADTEKAIGRWRSVIDRISDLGFDDVAELECLFRRRELEFVLQAPSACDASSSSGGVPEPVDGTDASATSLSSLPSLSSTTTASAAVSGPSYGPSVASRALCSSDLDPDLVEMERFVKMGDTVDVDGLIDFVEKSGRLKEEDERSLNFLGALVKSLCSKFIVAGDADDSVTVDEEEFKRCSKVLIRFATQRPRLEVKALDTIAEINCSKNCPKGLLVSLLSMLHGSSVIPTETFQEWWESNENLPGMLRASGEIKAFFSRFSTDAASEGGSDSDQGE